MAVVLFGPRRYTHAVMLQKDECGYAYLALEFYSIELVEERERGVVCRVEPAHWRLNKFRHELRKLIELLQLSCTNRLLLGKVSQVFLLSSRLVPVFCGLAKHAALYDDYVLNELDELATVMTDIRCLITPLLPVEQFGERPEYSCIRIETAAP